MIKLLVLCAFAVATAYTPEQYFDSYGAYSPQGPPPSHSQYVGDWASSQYQALPQAPPQYQPHVQQAYPPQAGTVTPNQHLVTHVGENGELVTMKPVYEELFEGGGTLLQRQLVDWLFTNGVNISYPYPVQYRISSKKGGGLYLTKDVERGDWLFSVPVSMMIYNFSPQMHPHTAAALQFYRHQMRHPGWPHRSLDLGEMALIIFLERKNPASFWAPYFRTLTAPDCPAFYDTTALAEFQSQHVPKLRLQFLRHVHRVFERLWEIPEFHSFLHPVPFENEVEEWLWAASTVLQRSFAWGPTGHRDYVLVPFLDLLNHDEPIENYYVYNKERAMPGQADAFLRARPSSRFMLQLRVDRPRARNSEMEISYQDNTQSLPMLLQYGFFLKDNPNDYFILSLPDEAVSNATESDAFDVMEKEFTSIRETKAPTTARCFRNGSTNAQFFVTLALLASGSQSAANEVGAEIQQGQCSSALCLAVLNTITSSIKEALQAYPTTASEDEALLLTERRPRHRTAIAYRCESKKALKLATSSLEQVQRDPVLAPFPKMFSEWPSDGVVHWGLETVYIPLARLAALR